MSVNVGSISARFGLDSAEFLEKLRGATGATELFSSQMKREMNQASREGAESLHLLDHALGISLPRSMNRLLTREFPAFGEALQSILGVGAVGVLIEASAQFGEKIAQHIEKAKKAEQDFDEALRHTQDVIGDLGASHARTMKEIELRIAEQADKPGAKIAAVDFKIDTAALDKAKKQIAEITEAMEKEAKAAELAGKWTTQFWAAVGYVADNFFSASSREADAADAKFKHFKLTLDELLQAHSVDPLQGLRDSLKKTSDELSSTGLDIARKMAALQAAGAFGNMPGHAGAQAKAQLTAGISLEALETEKRYFELLKQEQKLLADIFTEDQGHRKIATNDDSAEARKKALEADREVIREMQGDLKGWNDAANASLTAWMKTNAELEKAIANMDGLVESAQRGQKVKGLYFGDVGRVAPPTSGDVAAGKLYAFAGNQQAQFDLIAKAQEAALTPLQKYQIEWAKLELAFKDRADTDSLATKQAAENALIEDYTRSVVKAADATHKMQEEMMKMLERSDSAAAGIKAFGFSLQIAAAENGRFAYDVLTAGTKGAEEDVTKSLFAILEERRGGHLKLIHDLESMWSGYFKNLATMGMKHGMDELMGPIGKAITGGKGFAGSAMKDVALTENTHALMALTARMSFSGAPGMSAGAGAGGGFSALPSFLSAPFMAEGGDATPGSSFISGEAGAERVDLGSRGGAHITPLGVGAAGGDTYHNYDMRGAVVTEDLMRRSEAAHAIQASESRMMSAMPTKQREINLRKRS